MKMVRAAGVVLMLLACLLPGTARAADKTETKLLSLFDRNAEAATYATYCLKAPDPAVLARFDVNSQILGQALLNHLIDARPERDPAEIRTRLQERQNYSRQRIKALFAAQGCAHEGAGVLREHYGAVAAMEAAEMETMVYGRPLNKAP